MRAVVFWAMSAFAGALNLAAEVVRWVRVAMLRWSIDSTERYLLECRRDGIMNGDTIRHWHDQLAADRVRLALLEAGR